MIYFFIYFTICKQVYGEPYSNILFLEPLDVVEINSMPHKAFFGGWKQFDDLFLEVDAISSNGNVRMYGPFKNSDNLAGVFFENKNFTLRFINEGINPCYIAISFDSEANFDNYKNTSISFPDGFKTKIEDINRPLIYPYIGLNKKCETLVGVFGGFLGISFLLSIVIGLAIECGSS